MTEYAVYFKWLDDGTEDSFICNGYKDLVINLEDIKNRNDIELISVNKILKNGEYVPYKIPKKYL